MGVPKLALAIVTGLISLSLVPAVRVSAQGATFSNIAQGRYLVTAGDCASCHTAKKGKSFAGGRAIDTPFGILYSTNLTPDTETGIGQWSEQDFYNAMHTGIRRDGKHLYPAFPYPWFSKLTRNDVDAIKTFLDTLAPVKQQNKPPKLPWPLSWREAMIGWNTLYFTAGSFEADPEKSTQWNRGAYLVEGPGHCGLCHTPKNFLGAVNTDHKLAGGNAGEYWYAPSLTGDLRDGVGAWSDVEIVEYLKTGSNNNTATAGPMTEVVKNSTQYLSEADLEAIAIYLKDSPQKSVASQINTGDLGAPALARGEALYIDNCSGCHMYDGGGIARVFPPLKASAAIQAKSADTVIHVVLTGARMATTPVKPTGLAMPAFGAKLDDQQMVDVVNYIRHAWGNRAPLISAGNVADGRKKIAQSGAL